MKDFSNIKKQVEAERQTQKEQENAYRESLMNAYNSAKSVVAGKLAELIKSSIEFNVKQYYEGHSVGIKKQGLFGRVYELDANLGSTKFRTYGQDLHHSNMVRHVAVDVVPNGYGSCTDTLYLCPTAQYMNEVIREIEAKLKAEGYKVSVSTQLLQKFERARDGEVYMWDTYLIKFRAAFKL